MSALTLTLPLPPSQNRTTRHAMAHHRAKNAWRRTCWTAAVGQCIPALDPPARVRIAAHFRLRNLRDEDNLAQSMKWVLDALKQRQAGRLHWRQNVYPAAGYLVDDAPAFCTLDKPTQEIARGDEAVILTIFPHSTEAAA